MSRQSENYRDEGCPGSTKQRHDAGSLFRVERWVVGQKLLDPFSKRTDMPFPTRCDGRCMISAPVPTDPGAMNVARMKIRWGEYPLGACVCAGTPPQSSATDTAALFLDCSS